jgi:hypothetical protein
MANIRDVAKLADVSMSTVTYALNGQRRISEATRARVFEAIRELDYQPNTLAQSLKSGQSMILSGRGKRGRIIEGRRGCHAKEVSRGIDGRATN